MELTASVWRDPDVGKNDYMQDYRTWLEQDLLDVAMPMIYLSASNDAHVLQREPGEHAQYPTNVPARGSRPTWPATCTSTRAAAALRSRSARCSGPTTASATAPTASASTTILPSSTATAPPIARRSRTSSTRLAPPPPPPGPGNVLDDFEIDEGHFVWAVQPVARVANVRPLGRDHDRPRDHRAPGRRRRLATAEPRRPTAAPPGRFRHNSGIGAPRQPASNVPLAATGYVGFWLKTDDAGVTVRIGIDDPWATRPSRWASSLVVIADNQWHLYQWNLDDDDHWNAFAGGANGNIDGVNGLVSIDSIWFNGTGNVQIYLDTVSHNPFGPITAVPEPAAIFLAIAASVAVFNFTTPLGCH